MIYDLQYGGMDASGEEARIGNQEGYECLNALEDRLDCILFFNML